MKLYLAVAVLMLAFVAYTEAQDLVEEQTIEHRLNDFGEQVAEVGKSLAEKAKTTFEEIQNSKFATDSRDWFQRQIDNLKAKMA